MRQYILFFGIFLFQIENINSFGQKLPIKPTRTVSFTTDQGTYMDVDVSPDGRTLVFDLLGDLYTIPSKGGTARQLTRGIDLKASPAWSPDGKKIAYASDYTGDWHINVISIDGKMHVVVGDPNKRLGYQNNIVWSSDGNHVVVFDDNDNKRGYATYGLAGGKIIMEQDFRVFLRFSPDGDILYGIDSSGICSYSKNTGQKTFISTMPVRYYKEENFVLSPDARWLCYSADSNGKRSLLVKDLQTGTSRILIPSLIVKDPYYLPRILIPHYCFSPDSKAIYIGYGGKLHKVDVESGFNQVIPFTAKVRSDLGPLNYSTYRVNYDVTRLRYTRNAHASANGKHLVFAALNKIYIMDLPYGKPHVLVEQPFNQFQPVFSPDDKWVAYVSWNDTLGGYLWRVPVTGGKPEQLTDERAIYRHPAWSPDGGTIGVVKASLDLLDYESIYGNIGKLEAVSIPFKKTQIIADTIPLGNDLTFSNDGKRIIYTPVYKRDEKTNLGPALVSRNLAGGDLRTLAIDDGVTDGYIYQKSLSPDGRFLVYSSGEDLCLLPLSHDKDVTVISNYDDQKIDARQKVAAIRFAAGVDPYWEKGGKVLAWTYGSTFYRVDPDKVVAAAATSVFEQKGLWSSDYYKHDVKVDVPAGKHIDLSAAVVAKYGSGTIALKNVRILTMKGSKVIERGTIVINNGRIRQVGTASEIIVPVGVTVYNLQGTTVMPGLIDLHLHLHLPAGIFPQQSWRLLTGLAYGVTTARDPSAIVDQFGYAELIRSGQMLGPRLFTAGLYVQPDGRGIRHVEEAGDMRHIVDQRATMGAIVVKNYLSPVPRLSRQWLSMACKQAGLNMTNEGGHGSGIIDVGMAKDGSTGIEHDNALEDMYNDMIRFFAASGTFLTPTLQIGVGTGNSDAKAFLNYKYWHQADAKMKRFILSEPQQRSDANGASIETILHLFPDREKDTLHPAFVYSSANYAAIRHSGGRITLGSHGNEIGIGAHNELWALQMGGLTNMEALQAATIMGAEALGVQKDLGSLEVGKIADLIILNKNPLDDIHNSREIRYVMKDGILYDGDTLDELWPEQKKCPEWKLKTK